MDRCSLLGSKISCCTIYGSEAAHTVANLDLDMRIAFGNILYASNDFRHGRDVGKDLAWSLGGDSNGAGVVGSRETPVTGCFMYESPNRGASRERTLGQMIGPSVRLGEPDKIADETAEDLQT